MTGILNGTRAVTGDTAWRPAHFFGTSPQLWLNVQGLCELRLAERKVGKAITSLSSVTGIAGGGVDADLR